MKAIGVDGCKDGWVAARREDSTRLLEFAVFKTFTEILVWSEFPLIAVDIPIGIPDSGDRRCDQDARRRLGRPRGSSVFPAPVRGVLEVENYAEANLKHRSIDSRGLTAQTFNILKKIREVDEVMRETPDSSSVIFEVHPELTFCAISQSGRGLATKKRRVDGQQARMNLLSASFPDISIVQSERKKGIVEIDDLIDSVAALWTAERIVAGSATTIPEGLELLDGIGLQMRITF